MPYLQSVSTCKSALCVPHQPELKFISTGCSRSAAVGGRLVVLMEPIWGQQDQPHALEWFQHCPVGATEFQLCLPARHLAQDHTCTVCVQGPSRSLVTRNPVDLTRRFSIRSRKRQLLESGVSHQQRVVATAVTLLRAIHLRPLCALQVSGTTVGRRGVRRMVPPARTVCHRMACRAIPGSR